MRGLELAEVVASAIDQIVSARKGIGALDRAIEAIVGTIGRCREENRPKVELDTEAWEPALQARARQVVRRGELGT